MIRIAMLGAGRIGKIHARNIAANPRCQLVTVADPIADSARSLAESLGAESSTDAAAVLACPDIDAVVIGTPTDTHVDLMLAAAGGDPMAPPAPMPLWPPGLVSAGVSMWPYSMMGTSVEVGRR